MSRDDVKVSVWRGTNDAQGWEFKTEAGGIFPLVGNEIRLRVFVDGAAVITLSTDDDDHLVLDTDLGRLTWTPTIEESRLVPNGSLAQYEIERRIGGVERPLCAGVLEGVGGLNDDA